MDLILFSFFFATELKPPGDRQVGRDLMGVSGSPAGISHHIHMSCIKPAQMCQHLGKQGLRCGMLWKGASLWGPSRAWRCSSGDRLQVPEAWKTDRPSSSGSWLMRTLCPQAQLWTGESKTEESPPTWEPWEDGHGKSEGRWPDWDRRAGCGEVGACCHSNPSAPAEDRCRWCAVWSVRGIRVWRMQAGSSLAGLCGLGILVPVPCSVPGLFP